MINWNFSCAVVVGKLPASYLTEGKQEEHRKIKEGEDDKLLSQYQAFCGQVGHLCFFLMYATNLYHITLHLVLMLSIGSHIYPQVKVELLKIQKHDEPLHNLLVELMLEITKLVIGISFMRSTLW